jgi:hypothetical protein
VTDGIKYICHCNNCGDEFWIDKTDAADEIQCPTCKEMTPLTVKATACPERSHQVTCTCDEFKKALVDGSGDDMYFPAISPDREKYEIGCVPINFCPWCGKKVRDAKTND